MQESGHCRYYEWDESAFALPGEYMLGAGSDLADALRVFYLAGGYDFFHVDEPDYYASNWLEFMGNLYGEIVEGRYISSGRRYAIPLLEEQKRELAERGVPEVFVADI